MARLLVSSAITAWFVASGAMAQGVPVIDAAAQSQQIQLVAQALKDAQQQIAQIEELKKQVETQLKQLLALDEIQGALKGVNEIGNLFSDAQALADRAKKIADLSNFRDLLALGDFDSAFDLFQGGSTVGQQEARRKMEKTLGLSGLDQETIGKLSQGSGQDRALATSVASNATAMIAAETAYTEVEGSLQRLEGLRAAIGDQDTAKKSVDLNTRVTAEMAFLLGTLARLNAAAGIAASQDGLTLASEAAQTRKFFVFGDE